MLNMTDAASRKLGEIIAGHSQPTVGLRGFVQKGGCSGYSYGMALAEKIEDGDWVGEFGGVKVLVDPASAPVLDGVHIDYVESLQGSGFSISNPNAVRSCGCGNSFDTADTAESHAKESHE